MSVPVPTESLTCQAWKITVFVTFWELQLAMSSISMCFSMYCILQKNVVRIILPEDTDEELLPVTLSMFREFLHSMYGKKTVSNTRTSTLYCIIYIYTQNLQKQIQCRAAANRSRHKSYGQILYQEWYFPT